MPLITSKSWLDPILPDTLPRSIIDLADTLPRKTQFLAGRLAPETSVRLSRLLQITNTYYSNLIEGQYTEPADMQKAQSAPAKDRKQLRNLAVEQMEVQALFERALRQRAARGRPGAQRPGRGAEPGRAVGAAGLPARRLAASCASQCLHPRHPHRCIDGAPHPAHRGHDAITGRHRKRGVFRRGLWLCLLEHARNLADVASLAHRAGPMVDAVGR